MIFCTVGTQLPFNRLLRSVDDLAAKNSKMEFFGQIGNSEYQPTNFKWVRNIDETAYHDVFKKAKVVIGHAGMGTILTAFDYDIPVIIVPRLFEYGEHRNDHQLSTLRRFEDRSGIFSCEDLSRLSNVLEKAMNFADKIDKKNEKCLRFSYEIKSIVDNMLGGKK